MDIHLKYISDTEVKIDFKNKTIYNGPIYYIPNEILTFLNSKLYKFFKKDIKLIFKTPIKRIL